MAMLELFQSSRSKYSVLKSALGFYLIVVLAIITEVPTVVEGARIRHYKWEAKYEYKSPDCFKKLVITINGRSPGPTILAQQGDTIIVELKNSLITENVAIHWHGIRQIGSPWFDGTEGVTQCPIQPGETFKYQFMVDRPGTYLYHAHYGMQRDAGLYGSIRVALPDGQLEPFAYDYDRSILLNDWYHKSTHELSTGLSSKNFTWVGEPQSLLIQGKGKFNCSSLSSPSPSDPDLCNPSNPECSPYLLTVIPGKTYRLRVSSLTSLSALSFQIEGHNMTVVEADGHYVEPFVVKNLFIYSGETYSVLIKTDQNPTRNYWIQTSIVSRPSNTTGVAILNYYPNHPKRTPPTPQPQGPKWDDVDPRLAQSLSIKARKGLGRAPPQTSDRVIVMLNTQNTVDGFRRWSINNVSLNHPKTPYLISLKHNLTDQFDQNPPPDGYDFAKYDIYVKHNYSNATTSSGIYRLKFNTTVDIILQNANTMNPHNSETHPWHLHGHDFWVLGYGLGKFDIYKDPKKYNLADPIEKNTVPVHPYGWTALRFVADNPGAWAFHCHIESHFYMGMGVVFEEGIERVGRLPSSILGCGASKGLRVP
ncbi:L-ascorbate oxidase [Parasponia andersonii]|uniref:L-ascorbate oxidase n=1 Tax=Parasponia andersonii TaxID=3476 RepID=A0A2P5CW87_PARAD|nr:L-ascorbate oxidase [Parasponia andersonii]